MFINLDQHRYGVSSLTELRVKHQLCDDHAHSCSSSFHDPSMVDLHNLMECTTLKIND
jgi:hypothetical protein